MRKAKELRAQRAQVIEDARALIAGESPTAEQTAQFDAMMARADELKGQIDRLERAEQLAAEQEEALRAQAAARGTGVEAERARGEQEQGTFRAYLRAGFGGMSAEQRTFAEARFQAAQGTGSGAAGGYTVPQGFYDTLIDAQRAYGGMLEPGLANVIQTSTGNPLPVPTDNDTSQAGAILTENTQAGTQDVSFGSFTLGAYTYTSKIILVSNQLLQDSAFDLESFLRGKMAVRIARAVNTHLTVGSGAGQPTGVVVAATLGKQGVAGQTTSVIYDDLVDLEHSVDPAYRKNGRFMLSDNALKAIKKLKDSQGRPLWLPGIATREPDTILGMPYSVNQDMPAMAANAKSIAFGDFSNYMVRQVVGVQVMRLAERYADSNQTGFVAFQRWDGNLADAGTHPVQYYQNSAT